jgi:D-alanine-D-alanine ligase
VAVPRGIVVRELTDVPVSHMRRNARLDLPLVVKPIHEGSSRGIRGSSLCMDDVQLSEEVASILRDYGQAAVIEEYVEGREITVALVGDPVEVFGVMEVTPKDPARIWKLYSLDVKRHYAELAVYTCPPANLTAPVHEAIVDASLTAFHALGCKDMARVDFRLRADGTPVFLEINPIPGVGEHVSDIGVMADQLGIAYDELINRIVRGAMRRFGLPRIESEAR